MTLFFLVPTKTEVLVKDEPDSDSEDEGGAGKRPALQKGYEPPKREPLTPYSHLKERG